MSRCWLIFWHVNLWWLVWSKLTTEDGICIRDWLKKENLVIMSFFFQFGFLNCLSDSPYPVALLGWRITPLSPHGAPSEPQSNQKCHWDNQIWLSRLFHRKEGNSPLQPSNIKSFRFVLPRHLPGVVHHPSLTQGGPFKSLLPPKPPKMPQRSPDLAPPSF